ncbi:MAG: histidine phosphatase family protein [Methanoregula sp.]
MNHGDYILELLKKHRGTGRTILLIRHSVRESLRCIPDGLHEDVPITPEGIVHAEEFGRKLKTIVPDKPLLLGHTAPRRCRMTAESIRRGFSSPDNTRDLGILPDVESVIVDPGNFSALWEELGWHTLMRQWLSGEIPEHTLHNPHRYSNGLLRKLVSFPGIEDTDLLVVVAHDVTILPVLASACGTTLTTIDFLNGIVINAGRSGAEIRFADPENTLRAEWGPK